MKIVYWMGIIAKTLKKKYFWIWRHTNKTIQNENEREKNWKGKQNQWVVDHHIKQPNTSVIRIPEGE